MGSDGLVHGGRLDDAVARFGGTRADWVDLSTGINPWPWPVPEISVESWTRLPDTGAVEAAVAAARRAYGAPAEARVVVGNGSQALIQALPFCRERARVAVVGPTYGEHEASWRRAGHEVRVVPDLDAAAGWPDVMVATNPNNPDGRIIEPEHLLAVADRLARVGGHLVVDEAFADVTPGTSLASAAGRPGLCVLRSFGKFFGLAGARIGFALCDGPLGRALDEHLGPWPASGMALEIAARALADEAWIAASRERLVRETRALHGLLAGCGHAVAGSTDLFTLVDCANGHALWQDLCEARILTRSFPQSARLLRMGLPPSDEASERLRTALGGIA